VELLRRYANRSDLLFDLCQATDRLQSADRVSAEEDPPQDLTSACSAPRRRLLSTRFTCEDVASMTTEYESGTPARIIAEEHRIGLTSLKQLIRQCGARRKDRQTESA
jgi:hypothetical protein